MQTQACVALTYDIWDQWHHYGLFFFFLYIFSYILGFKKKFFFGFFFHFKAEPMRPMFMCGSTCVALGIKATEITL